MSVNSKMAAIADAIREKTGESGTLTLDAMAAAIAGIEAGGGGGFPNGTEWTQSNVTSGSFSGVHNANGIWVAGGTSVGLYYSTDGKTWTQSNVTSGKFCNCIHNANGIWVASGENGIYYSTDGMTWTQSNVTSSMGSYLYLIAEYANGIWVAGNMNACYYSTDGMTWTQSNGISTMRSVYNANGIWVAATTSGLYYSPTWQPA